MSFVTGENVIPLTAVMASTDTRQALGDFVWDRCGRKYKYVQLVASVTGVVSYGNGVAWDDSTGYINGLVATSSDTTCSNARFAGVAVNKEKVASAGQKFWIMTEGPLGTIANSKLKSEHSPVLLYAKCSTTVGLGKGLSFARALKGFTSATNSVAKHVGIAGAADSGGLLTRGYIRSRWG